jgi:ectoine hydroxylase-related dioxygenase (phytanoyl-CoA dioxygenase family)
MSVPEEHFPDFSDEYDVSTEQIDQFRKDGHILLKNVASRQEISFFHPFLQQAVLHYNREQRAVHERTTDYERAFLQVQNLWEKCDVLKCFVTAHRFAKIAADLLGARKVRLYYDCALFKEPGGGHTPMHIDPFVVDAHKVITMWIPFVDLTDGLRSLTFVSGSHLLEDKRKSPLRLINEAFRKGLPMVSYSDMEAGDATFHSGWMIHSAEGNATNRMREVLAVTYFAEDQYLLDSEENELKSKHFREHFPGLRPGDLAASHLTPLLYCKSGKL